MNYKELASNYSLEEVVALNRLLDFLLEHDYRLKRDYIEGARAEGELLEQEIFLRMGATPK